MCELAITFTGTQVTRVIFMHVLSKHSPITRTMLLLWTCLYHCHYVNCFSDDTAGLNVLF